NALLGYLNFEPLPGDVGFFSGDVTFADAEGDSWIWHYAGTAITAAAEPATLLLFGAALAALFVMRRRRAA
ncbi:MAG: hypothetical protein JWL84_71, partial [Rhodospirillales bacterium]|nr:hypothetical protein [Rhodospirillales bacterium]